MSHESITVSVSGQPGDFGFAYLHLTTDTQLVASDLPEALLPFLREIGAALPRPPQEDVDGWLPASALWLRSACTRLPISLSEVAAASDIHLWDIHSRGCATLSSAPELLSLATGQQAATVAITNTGAVGRHTEQASLLDCKLELARRQLSACVLCEWRCGANRHQAPARRCGSGAKSHITRAFVNYGEERALTPSYTLFFAGCNWRCLFCQYPLELDAQAGMDIPPGLMAAAAVIAQGRGARTLHFLGGNPDQHIPYALEMLSAGDRSGLRLPVVWNANGYASVEAMRLLEGIVDVYLLDLRFGNETCARQVGGAPRAWEAVTRNIDMVLQQYAQGQMGAQVVVRHLELPGHFECCTVPCLGWLAEPTRREQVRVNLMDGQYLPTHRATGHRVLGRRLLADEIQRTKCLAMEMGLRLID